MNKFYLILLPAIVLITKANAQFPDTLNRHSCAFEDSCYYSFKIDTTHGRLWQIGASHKMFFGNAYYKPNALMTDTLKPYVPGTKAHFDIVIPIIKHFDDIAVSFKHKYQTALHQDGGYIQYSFDKGTSWWLLGTHDTNVLYYSSNYGVYNDTLRYGIKAFTGSQSNWQTTTLVWSGPKFVRLSAWPDTLLLRFNFVSDSTSATGNAGWIIDNFESYNLFYGWGIDNLSIGALHISPNPAADLVNIQLDVTLQGALQVQVTDVLGKTVLMKNYTANGTIQLPVTEIPTGLYFVQLWQHEKLINRAKVVINRP